MDGLKLRAVDGDDLKVVSAMLQDAIVPICDLAYLPGERRFILIANRFRWEAKETGAEAAEKPAPAGPTPDEPSFESVLRFERVNCAVRFEGVEKVAYRGLDLSDRKQMLNLLAVEAVEGATLLHFSGGGGIRLVQAALDCAIEDLGEPWPTGNRPTHALDD